MPALSYSKVGVIETLSQYIPYLVEVVMRVMYDQLQLPLCFLMKVPGCGYFPLITRYFFSSLPINILFFSDSIQVHYSPKKSTNAKNQLLESMEGQNCEIIKEKWFNKSPAPL